MCVNICMFNQVEDEQSLIRKYVINRFFLKVGQQGKVLMPASFYCHFLANLPGVLNYLLCYQLPEKQVIWDRLLKINRTCLDFCRWCKATFIQHSLEWHCFRKKDNGYENLLVYATCQICELNLSITSVLLEQWYLLNQSRRQAFLYFFLLDTQIKRKVYTLFLIPLFHMSPDRTSKTRYAGLTISTNIIQSWKSLPDSYLTLK